MSPSRISVWALLCASVVALFFLPKQKGDEKPVQPIPAVQSQPLAVHPPPSVVPKFYAVAKGTPHEKFTSWLKDYQSADATQKASLTAAGIEIAQERQTFLKALIKSNPEEALQSALSYSERKHLPSEVLPFVEKQVKGRGNLDVFGALPEPGKESEVTPVFRTASISGQEYEAYVYGRRLGLPTQRNVPLHGIAVDNVVALHQSPARKLDAEEIADLNIQVDPTCSVAQTPAPVTNSETVAFEVAEEVRFFCGVGHLAAMEELLEGDENNARPGYFMDTAESAYTEGRKSMIVIRVDFSDLAGAPLNDAACVTMISNLNNYFTEASYGRTSFHLDGQGSTYTPTFRLPQTARFYGTNGAGSLRTDARAAARAAGFDLNNYNFDLICFGSVPGFSWAGLGYIGAPGSWLRNSFGTGTAAHELGHNFGLNHASFWDTSGQSIIGAGSPVEYGDTFDTMGSGGSSRAFNARYKSYLNWLYTNEVATATSNGIYRIYAHDVTNATTGIRGLKIIRSSGTNYWLELRQKPTSTVNNWLMNGLQLRWTGNGNQHSHLLDTTPGSPDGRTDSPIALGRTFSDVPAGIHITPLRKNGTVPESIDVMVNRGTFPANQPPALTLSGNTTVAVNSSLLLTATGTDPDNDTLAYSWTTSDGKFGTNGPRASFSWSSAGEYSVRCVVTDMKGGTASRNMIIRVGSPSTFRIAGRVTLNGQAVEGARVFVSSTRMAYTDAAGYYSIVGLPSGSYTINAMKEGLSFSHPGFANPIFVGPNFESATFLASSAGGLNYVPLISAGSEWKYLDNGSNQGSSWTQPSFNDELWDSGPAPLGYGDGDEVTIVGYGPNPDSKFITTYFRQSFTIEDPNEFVSLQLGLVRDDGAIVYLNGVEVFRSNMPQGPVTYTTRALEAAEDEDSFQEADIDPRLLRAGTNVVAVQVHQNSSTSSDMSFDFFLRSLSIRDLPRGVYVATPEPNALHQKGNDLEITINASSGRTGSISRVEAFVNNQKVGEATTFPYSINWQNPPFGTYTLIARAFDSGGTILTSAPVNFNVSDRIIPVGSVWKYGVGAVAPLPAWTTTNYSDVGWASGAARLGYGDSQTTTIGFGPSSSSKYISTYFRRAVVLDNSASITNFLFRFQRDDGLVAYVNGVEAFRSNMPEGVNIAWSTLALEAADGSDETAWFTQEYAPTNLVSGTNIIAVELHQSAANSSDLGFDMELIATGSPPPSAPPSIVFTNGSNGLSLEWPESHSSWQLFTTTNLSDPQSWTPVAAPMNVGNGKRTFTVTPSGRQGFYQLRNTQ